MANTENTTPRVDILDDPKIRPKLDRVCATVVRHQMARIQSARAAIKHTAAAYNTGDDNVRRWDMHTAFQTYNAEIQAARDADPLQNVADIAAVLEPCLEIAARWVAGFDPIDGDPELMLLLLRQARKCADDLAEDAYGDMIQRIGKERFPNGVLG